ncbi:TonB-dependent receptor [Empedobacter falsenii]|uniref:TonB-dependent receptor n=1 Tax=Empedobacter falsenii TaxID=343874 RepID=UPI00257659C9|nr:TonB-dependent receptor [Empedobacter falsenii]MDM1297637.1 TonB-dependent receptor [Empedobacter falsenii]MDM1317431.1 TonB-dependent receptor [Empedobacter falsenii]
MRNLKTIIICCSLILLSCRIAYAQIIHDSILELQQVNILKNNIKAVVPVQELKGEQLEALNSHSVADAVRFFAGVQIKDYGGVGGLKTIDVRGMGSQHVAVFYDGIQLGNAQNGIVDLGKFSLDDMEVISLYNGQKSNIFQSAKDYASASAIYLQTKKPVFIGDKKTNATLRYKLGSIQLINPSIRIEQKITDRLSAVFSTEYIKTNGVYKFRYQRKNLDGTTAYDTVLKRRDGQVDAKRLELGLIGKGNQSNWNVKGYLYDSDRGIPAAIVRGRFDGRGQTLVDRNYFVQGKYEKRFRNFQSKINAKFAYDFTHYTDTVSTVKTENKYTQREFYVSWANLYSITDNWDVNVATDYQFNNMGADLKNFSFPTRHTNLVAFASTYRFGRLSMQGSLLGTFVKESVEMNTSAPDKNVWTPTIIANYQPFKSHDFNIRAFYKRIFRMPTFNDLYYTNIGYSNLRPEYSTQYNVGFTYSKSTPNFFKNITIQADAFYNEVTDKIVAAPSGSLFRFTMLNLDEVRIKGLDVKIRSTFQLGEIEVSPMLNYGFLQALDYSNSKKSYYKNQIPYTPKHSGSFVLAASYKTWNFNYSFIYVGERYNVHQDNIKINRLNPWFTNDLGIHKEFRLNQNLFKVSFELNNILNQQYDVVLNYPMPGRQFKLILSANL